jgi:hypothetical protein
MISFPFRMNFIPLYPPNTLSPTRPNNKLTHQPECFSKPNVRLGWPSLGFFFTDSKRLSTFCSPSS